MECERAVIVVGGVGSRGMPWTYANEKCQLPLPAVAEGPDGRPQMATRSVVDFVVGYCLDAGINDITFVVGEDTVNTRRAYEGNPPVDRYFSSRDKETYLKQIREVGSRAAYHFIPQPYGEDVPYGTTYPLELAKDVIGQEGQTLIVMGDQFFHRPDDSSEVTHFLEGVRTQNVTTGMLVRDVPPDMIHHYGITRLRPDGFLDRIVEKPAVGSIPEHGANCSMYVVNNSIMPYVTRNMSSPPAGTTEHMLTDVMNEYAQEHPVAVVHADGRYVDCGTTQLWLGSVDHMKRHAEAVIAANG